MSAAITLFLVPLILDIKGLYFNFLFYNSSLIIYFYILYDTYMQNIGVLTRSGAGVDLPPMQSRPRTPIYGRNLRQFPRRIDQNQPAQQFNPVNPGYNNFPQFPTPGPSLRSFSQQAYESQPNHKEPPFYYGRPGEDFEAWHQAYDSYSAYKGLNNARKLQVLQFALKDYAYNTLAQCPANQNQAAIDAAVAAGNNPPAAVPHDYASIVQYLWNHFITQGVPTVAMDRFCSRRQRVGEDVSSFYYELIRLAKAMNPNNEIDEEFVKRRVMSTLLEPLKTLMCMQKPDTLNDALIEARRLESNRAGMGLSSESKFPGVESTANYLNNVVGTNYYSQDRLASD